MLQIASPYNHSDKVEDINLLYIYIGWFYSTCTVQSWESVFCCCGSHDRKQGGRAADTNTQQKWQCDIIRHYIGGRRRGRLSGGGSCSWTTSYGHSYIHKMYIYISNMEHFLSPVQMWRN